MKKSFLTVFSVLCVMSCGTKAGTDAGYAYESPDRIMNVEDWEVAVLPSKGLSISFPRPESEQDKPGIVFINSWIKDAGGKNVWSSRTLSFGMDDSGRFVMDGTQEVSSVTWFEAVSDGGDVAFVGASPVRTKKMTEEIELEYHTCPDALAHYRSFIEDPYFRELKEYIQKYEKPQTALRYYPLVPDADHTLSLIHI